MHEMFFQVFLFLKIFISFFEKFNKLTPAQDRALYRFMTPNSGIKMSEAEERILTADLRKLGAEGRTVVDTMGQELQCSLLTRL